MSDEIKEILEKPNVYSFNDECYLFFGDYNKLKDYITNLQQRIEKAIEYVKEMDTQLEVYGDYDILSDNKNDLLNILNGRSDE